MSGKAEPAKSPSKSPNKAPTKAQQRGAAIADAARAAALVDSIRKEERSAPLRRNSSASSNHLTTKIFSWSQTHLFFSPTTYHPGTLTGHTACRAQGRWLQRQAETNPELAAAYSAASLGLTSGPSAPEVVQPPELYQSLRNQSLARPDKGSSLDISQALSNSINPGYYLQDPAAIKSQSKDDYTLDESEVRDDLEAISVCTSFAHHHQNLCHPTEQELSGWQVLTERYRASVFIRHCMTYPRFTVRHGWPLDFEALRVCFAAGVHARTWSPQQSAPSETE